MMRKQVLLCFLLFLAAVLLGGFQRKRLAQDILVEFFSYETVGTMAGSETEFSIIRDESGFAVTERRGGRTVCELHVDHAVGAQVTDILCEHQAHSWNGFAKTNPHVLDGTSFTLHIVFDDGTAISARGTNSYPKGLSAAVGEIKNLIDRFLREPEQ